jgi:DNA polymerase
MSGGDGLADAAALAWLVAVGADEAIADAPVDRLSAVERIPDRPASPPPPPTRSGGWNEAVVETPQAIPLGTPEAAATARALADAATTLEELKQAIAGFDGIALKATATNLVFADGNPKARLMLIGEAPGAEEDRRGLPFVGAAGQLLDRMLAAIGRDRNDSYITNIVNWRPPGNRKPSPAEMQLCRPFIERHIALIDPAVIILLGDTAARTLTGRTEGITRLRGRWFAWTKPDGAAIPMLPTFHPAFLLRSPAQKRETWIDLLTAKRKLAEVVG